MQTIGPYVLTEDQIEILARVFHYSGTGAILGMTISVPPQPRVKFEYDASPERVASALDTVQNLLEEGTVLWDDLEAENAIRVNEDPRCVAASFAAEKTCHELARYFTEKNNGTKL